MIMNLSMFLSVIDGGENIRVTSHNDRHAIYEGKKVDCPFIDAEVIVVWADRGGKIIIEVNK